MNSIDQAASRTPTSLVAQACCLARAAVRHRARGLPAATRRRQLRRRKRPTRSSWPRPTVAARRRNGPAKSSTTPAANCSCGLPTAMKKPFRPRACVTESTPLGPEQQAGDTAWAEGNFRLRTGALPRGTRGPARNPRVGAPANPGPDRLVLQIARRVGAGLRLFFDSAGPRSHDAVFRLSAAGLAAGGAEPDPGAQGERVAGPGRDAGRHAAGGEPLAADGRTDGGAGGACAAVDRSGPADCPVGPSPGVADGGLSSDGQAMCRLAASRWRRCPRRCVPAPTSSSVRPWSAGNRKRERCGYCGRRSCIRASGKWLPPALAGAAAALDKLDRHEQAQVAVGRDRPVVSRPGAGGQRGPGAFGHRRGAPTASGRRG